ncbi:DUF4190 domain-containing protein [Streptomyces sp. CB03238]|uniref:DUF4190 domain-containing protein n=1 Tax=Streptomyces sp. CB03238 TaxID=1907777 RepID=UPI000A100953|nr:DUF4190 domain-containing protein [Streptomyces sp. CB03238]ORT58485.1 hypothetical protein BKD26_17945 [Streptomyces sp. CB03238]
MSDFTQQPQYGAQQPYPGGPGPYGGAPAPLPARNGLGTAALVLGIIGAVSGLIPFLFWLAGILGLIAVILGLTGRGRVKRGEATNKGVTTTGAVLGLVSLILSVVGAVLTYKAMDDVVDEYNKGVADTASQDPAADKGGDPAEKDAGAADDATKGKPLAAGDTSVYDNDVQVTVSEAKSVKPGEFAVGHTEGNKAYELTIVVENAGKEKFSTDSLSVSARAGKEGVTAEEIFDGDTYGNGFNGDILPGKKATVKYAFDAPADAKTLTVEVSPGFDYDAVQWDLKL